MVWCILRRGCGALRVSRGSGGKGYKRQRGGESFGLRGLWAHHGFLNRLETLNSKPLWLAGACRGF